MRVAFAEAPAAILSMAEQVRLAAGLPVAVVALGGPAGAGKSTLAERLGAATLSTDWYLPDYDETPEHLRDLPESADLALLGRHLAELASGRGVDAPVWSFHTHRREGNRRVEAGSVVVVEGIHALHAPLLPLIHVPVFVEAPGEIRWKRWELIESAGLRGWGVEKAKDYFERIAEPVFREREAGYRAAARVIVSNESGLPRFG